MSAIYNEIDPFAVRWLRNLITAGHIAPGVVDERSISDLVPADVAGLGQRHFFAGIAGWSLALRLAGVPDNANVWTGSCPCQGLSEAGRRLGFADPRHLWPIWFRLIAECRPSVVFGEQSASPLGLEWLDLVFSDLERAGYACAAADLCAAGAGAPHRRQRLFFVAYSGCQSGRLLAAQWQSRRTDAKAERRGETGELADTDGSRCRSRRPGKASDGRDTTRIEPAGLRDAVDWQSCDWIPCSDGVARPVEPGTHPLAHGIPGRVGLLRGYGNAIVPQVAAEFVCAALEAA